MKKCVIIILTFLYIIQGTAKDTREIIIRGDSAFPPYEFINDKGEPDGFNIDLTRAIMDELKLPYDLQLEDWSDILQQFEKGEIDRHGKVRISSKRPVQTEQSPQLYKLQIRLPERCPYPTYKGFITQKRYRTKVCPTS